MVCIFICSYVFGINLFLLLILNCKRGEEGARAPMRSEHSVHGASFPLRLALAHHLLGHPVLELCTLAIGMSSTRLTSRGAWRTMASKNKSLRPRLCAFCESTCNPPSDLTKQAQPCPISSETPARQGSRSARVAPQYEVHPE